MNICDYIEWRGDLSFEADPFCEADALIFAWLSYYPAEKLMLTMEQMESLTLKSLYEIHLQQIGEIKDMNVKLNINPTDSGIYLLKLAALSDRFGSVRVLRFRTMFSQEDNTQFAAFTYEYLPRQIAISYRGTDGSVTGWREDFMMCCSDAIPSQHLAREYLEAEDPEEECRAVDRYIEDAGGIDLMLLGIGMNGHIALNEPGENFDHGTHIVELSETTKSVGQKYFSKEMQLSRGITLGMRQVFGAKKVILQAGGKAKAQIISQLYAVRPQISMPASVLALVEDGVVILDKDAAGEIDEEIRQEIGADSLGYLSVESLRESVKDAHIDLCDGCFTEHYSAEVPTHFFVDKYANKINRK